MEYECLRMSIVHKFCKITRFYQAKREDDKNFILQSSEYLPALGIFFLKRMSLSVFLSAI